ncbi:hypothetical protein [Rhodoferax sp. U11-2br]|uniref:hypothetical protein n=1 Tax=Rhodoferax sp. U11-2br TaxID=2838878 RepID=UPI001BEA8181|nr:hypothetical protein [Rhodoferax sp. U11-2br]MBT3065857.1 hypothetical protein [Rhodoferax sp. U11-2br]
MDSKVSATAITYVYSLLIGGAYLVGYWLPFGLNILAFADLTDIIKASVLPMLPAVGLLLTYSALDGLNSISKKQHDEYIAEGGFFKYYMKFMVLYSYGMTAFFLCHAAYIVITEPGYQKLKGVFPLASLLVFIYLVYGNRHLLALDVKSRVFVISILCFLPTAAFITGNRDGEQVERLEGVLWEVKAKETCSSSADKLVLLARLSNKYLTMSRSDKSICVIPDERVQLTRLPRASGA